MNNNRFQPLMDDDDDDDIPEIEPVEPNEEPEEEEGFFVEGEESGEAVEVISRGKKEEEDF